MRPLFLLGEVWTGLRRSASMATSIMIVTAVSLLFFGIGLLAQRQVETAKGYWYDKVEVSIFLCTKNSSEDNCRRTAVTQDQIDHLGEQLNTMKPVVKDVAFESQEEAYKRFKEQFTNPAFQDTPQEAIPAAYRVKLSNPKDYDLMYQAFNGAPGVSSVKDIRAILQPLFRAMDFLRYGAWSLSALMLVCTVLLTSTTVRQVAWSRRREIAIKRVVGASKASVQLPFMVETLSAVVAGCLLAIGGLVAFVYYGVMQLARRFQDFRWVDMSDVWAVAPTMAVLGIIVGGVVSWLALIRYVRV
ncbi:Cell division protein FtsX [Austwickia sp. TVS 96-490-7B]|uniref:permease-like cell division protein FtsX n=1 Tax=Austwickia sp. TVS 96-490-7B TaxID=2830843 RepID=UPI001D1AEF57|nr:permease-like cell division protein FtsX [Austwickia sp. TVS 96-490-7B]MBW3086574.1 Cell division protein FtsX [Austwickia sp. TVS 96-490-7B]